MKKIESLLRNAAILLADAGRGDVAADLIAAFRDDAAESLAAVSQARAHLSETLESVKRRREVYTPAIDADELRSLRQQSEAWGMVWGALRKHDPEFPGRKATGIASALDAIERLAARTAAARKEGYEAGRAEELAIAANAQRAVSRGVQAMEAEAAERYGAGYEQGRKDERALVASQATEGARRVLANRIAALAGGWPDRKELLLDAANALRASVSARDVFAIAGGDVEVNSDPTPEAALDCLRDLRSSYREALDELYPEPMVLHFRGEPALPAREATGERMWGEVIEADFERDTLTLKMEPGYFAAAGRYLVQREEPLPPSAKASS
jgi:hypothetical protein